MCIGDDSVTQAKGSQETEEFFKRHQCNTKKCVLCYMLYYSPLCTDRTKGLLPSKFCESVASEETDQRRNYFECEKVEVKEAISRRLESAEDTSPPTDCTGVKHLYSLHFASLFRDVNMARTTSLKLEAYFDQFYICLLRQLLEKNGLDCQLREKELKESQRTKRKVDFLASTRAGTVLVLESAMNGNEAKIESDLGKLAMEIYSVWEKSRKCPPLGVLVRPWTGNGEAKIAIFEVYTMVQKAKTNCLIALDVFMTPMTELEVGLSSTSIEPCANFVNLLPGSAAETRSCESFIEACNGVNRIVEACKSVALLKDGGINELSVGVQEVSLSEEDSNRTGSVNNAPRTASGGRKFQDLAQPAKTPKKTPSQQNCCCAQFKVEARNLVEITTWSEVWQVVHRTTGQHFICKGERSDWHEHDDVDWNPFDTEVSVFMKMSTLSSRCVTLVKPVDVCTTNRRIFMEQLEEVNWEGLRSNDELALLACLDILESVATLHGLNVAHCDIKASAVMVRHASGGTEHFVLCDFNLAVVNADQYEYSLIPFGSSGWSLRSHQYFRASAKDHDCFSLGLLLATSCCTSACEIVVADGSVDFHDTLASLVKVAQENNDQIRHAILQVALLLCHLESSSHDALRHFVWSKTSTLRARLWPR